MRPGGVRSCASSSTPSTCVAAGSSMTPRKSTMALRRCRFSSCPCLATSALGSMSRRSSRRVRSTYSSTAPGIRTFRVTRPSTAASMVRRISAGALCLVGLVSLPCRWRLWIRRRLTARLPRCLTSSTASQSAWPDCAPAGPCRCGVAVWHASCRSCTLPWRPRLSESTSCRSPTFWGASMELRAAVLRVRFGSYPHARGERPGWRQSLPQQSGPSPRSHRGESEEFSRSSRPLPRKSMSGRIACGLNVTR